MPVRPLAPPIETPRRGGVRPLTDVAEQAPMPEESTSGPGMGTLATLLGGAGLVGAGLAARNPSAAWKGVKAGAKGLNSLRQQLMLSGYALPKSVAGGIGAVGEATAEGLEDALWAKLAGGAKGQAALPGMGTSPLAPLKELFKTQTLKDIKDAYKTHQFVGPTPGVTSKLPSPGRAMAAVDTGLRNVLMRAGKTPSEAQSALLQAPIGKIGEVLESPIAQGTYPFRRTGVNAFTEGWEKIKQMREHPLTMAGYAGAGALHGAATADERYPTSVPFAMAASARYGVPYGLAALAARGLMGANVSGTGIASSMVPFGEYGTEQSATPEGFFRPLFRPGIAKVWEDISGEGR